MQVNEQSFEERYVLDYMGVENFDIVCDFVYDRSHHDDDWRRQDGSPA